MNANTTVPPATASGARPMRATAPITRSQREGMVLPRARRFALSALLLCPLGVAKVDISEKPICQKGKPQCVKLVVNEMAQRLRRLARTCDHDAIFSLAYLRTTEKYRETLSHIGYEDSASVTREDALFADYYFRAFDAYHSGDAEVPPAWQIAFQTAETKSLSSVGNAFLGFNAHIQRDLPFTLYELYERGTPVSEFDHFKVNEFLAQVSFSQEIADRFDPAYPLISDASIVFEWRAIAWANYVALRDAPSEEARAAVAANIEEYAAGVAAYFASITQLPPGTDSSERDAYCTEHGFPGPGN